MTVRRIVLFALWPAIIGGCSSDRAVPSSATAVDARTPVVLDYSPTVSDAGALLYLARNQAVDLLAVTLPATGEAECVTGVRTTRRLLALADRGEVPVACGSSPALGDGHPWPDGFRQYANTIETFVDLPTVDDAATGDAVDLLADTIAGSPRPVTLVAVAPLTNVAEVLQRNDVGEHIDRLVIMGGAVDTAGNVEGAPAAEWNFHVDPEAARQVLAAPVDLLLVGLDATADVPWTPARQARVDSLDGPIIAAEQQLIGHTSLDGLQLWDELAAVAAVNPALVSTERRTVAVDADGATATDFRGSEIAFAASADGDAVVDAWLTVLHGGPLPPTPAMTAAEGEYFASLDAITARTQTAFETVFVTPPPGEDPDATASRIADTFVSTIGELRGALMELDAPPAVSADHQRLLAAVESLNDKIAAFRAAIAIQTASDPFERLDAAAQSSGAAGEFERVGQACGSLSGASLLRGGPALCDASG